MTDKSRKAFEAEILKNKAAFQIIRVASGEYKSGSTQELWEYWQAATAAERKPLSDETIDAVTDAQWGKGCEPNQYLAHRAYARAIEAAIRQGE